MMRVEALGHPTDGAALICDDTYGASGATIVVAHRFGTTTGTKDERAVFVQGHQGGHKGGMLTLEDWNEVRAYIDGLFIQAEVAAPLHTFEEVAAIREDTRQMIEEARNDHP